MKKWFWVAVSLLVITAGCGDDPDSEAQRDAAEVAIKAVSRNIPSGERIQIVEMRTYPGRYGAVCGSGNLGEAPVERFWVGSTDRQGDGTPVLERWKPSRALNDEMFSSYCKGMVTISPSLYSAVAEGSQTQADRDRGEKALQDALAKARHNARTPEEIAAHDRKIIAVQNQNIRAYNARIKAAYERGSEVCRNLKKAGYSDGNGCPRPKPEYLDLKQASVDQTANGLSAGR